MADSEGCALGGTC